MLAITRSDLRGFPPPPPPPPPPLLVLLARCVGNVECSASERRAMETHGGFAHHDCESGTLERRARLSILRWRSALYRTWVVLRKHRGLVSRISRKVYWKNQTRRWKVQKVCRVDEFDKCELDRQSSRMQTNSGFQAIRCLPNDRVECAQIREPHAAPVLDTGLFTSTSLTYPLDSMMKNRMHCGCCKSDSWTHDAVWKRIEHFHGC